MDSRSDRTRSLGLRPTRVCRWYVSFVAIGAVAAINTGNNGLFLVVAFMLAVLPVVHWLASANVRNVSIEVQPPPEIYANTPSTWTITCRHRGRFLLRRRLEIMIDVEGRGEQTVASGHLDLLAAGRSQRVRPTLIFSTRGVKTIRRAQISSLFPFGLFTKARAQPIEIPVVVFPELFAFGDRQLSISGQAGDERGRRVGWGHELLALRAFRSGDDPRGIHWKQSARTGAMVYQERREEENRRVAVVFDNAVGADGGGAHFERLVSEAATAAADLLERGYEVALQTRDEVVGFGGGRLHRQLILKALAVLDVCERSQLPLRPIHQPAIVLSPLEDRAA